MVAGAPFELAEKSQALVGVAASWDALVVPAAVVHEKPAEVKAFADAQRAALVLTGWVEKPGDELRLGATLWHVGATGPRVVAESSQQGPQASYHTMLGALAVELWTAAAAAPWHLVASPSAAAQVAFARPFAKDVYATALLGRALGKMSGALPPVDLAAADRDLKKALLIAPDCAECNRMAGEWLRMTAAPPQKAFGKFSYALDLLPGYLPAAGAAAAHAFAQQDWTRAVRWYGEVLRAEPWDLGARYHYGAALAHVGKFDEAGAQLDAVLQRLPNHVDAHRARAQVAMSVDDHARYIAELQRVIQLAPDDMQAQSDAAAFYVSREQWGSAEALLNGLAARSDATAATWLRVAEVAAVQNNQATTERALQRAQALGSGPIAPYWRAQFLYKIGQYAGALAALGELERAPRAGAPGLRAAAARLRALVALAMGDVVAAGLAAERAMTLAPQELASAQVDAAAQAALGALTRARIDGHAAQWPADPVLQYFVGVFALRAGDSEAARRAFAAALAMRPGFGAVQRALLELNRGATDVRPENVVEHVGFWGDARAIRQAVVAFEQQIATLAPLRTAFRNRALSVLRELGRGPFAVERQARTKPGCPVARVAPLWISGEQELAAFTRAGAAAETWAMYVARHEELGLLAGLQARERTRAYASLRAYRVALAELRELRALWQRGVGSELTSAGCTTALLQAALEQPDAFPRDDVRLAKAPPRLAARPQAPIAFTVDNASCAQPMALFVDGLPLGSVPAKGHGVFTALGGERTLCLLFAPDATCGERGTLRHVFLHDGWQLTTKCP